MEWYEAVKIVQPHVVRISTPSGSGTGFLICNGKNTDYCGVATAAHVIDHAHYWEQPIRVDHQASGKSVVVRQKQRAVLLDKDADTAGLFFRRGEITFPAAPLDLTPEGMYLTVGNELAWLGFPAVAAESLCFFSGVVSAWIESQKAYLIDGVAINGVSGGPAFTLLRGREGEKEINIIGAVSAYVPNRATGEVLPGVSVVRDVTRFHEWVKNFPSLDEVRKAEPLAVPPQPALQGEDKPPSEVHARRGSGGNDGK